MSLVARCVYCKQSILDPLTKVGKADDRCLRDHLLGCPAAISAFAPALPIPRRHEDLLTHFTIEESQSS